MILSSRSSAMVAGFCVVAGLAVVTIGGMGITGVRSTAANDQAVTTEEMSAITMIAHLANAIEHALAGGQALALTEDPAERDTLAADLYNEEIPAVEASLQALEQNHGGEGHAEGSDIETLHTEWAALRSELNRGRPPSGGGVETAVRLREAYEPLHEHMQAMVDDKATDATDRQAASDTAVGRLERELALMGGLALLVICGLGLVAGRRLRREIEPAQEQAEFADTLQLSESEEEAHQLLQRQLQRAVQNSTVTILNRNNSSDRLEAMTEMPADSLVAERLEYAEPRSCLAIRSARVHDEDARQPPLLGCPVCTGCPGLSTCTPLTVGGEVIGSVLVNRPQRYRSPSVGRSGTRWDRRHRFSPTCGTCRSRSCVPQPTP